MFTGKYPITNGFAILRKYEIAEKLGFLNIKYSDKKSKMAQKEEQKDTDIQQGESKYFVVMWCKRSNKKHRHSRR